MSLIKIASGLYRYIRTLYDLKQKSAYLYFQKVIKNMELIGIFITLVVGLLLINVIFWVIGGIFNFIIWLLSATVSNIFSILVFGIFIYVLVHIL